MKVFHQVRPKLTRLLANVSIPCSPFKLIQSPFFNSLSHNKILVASHTLEHLHSSYFPNSPQTWAFKYIPASTTAPPPAPLGLLKEYQPAITTPESASIQKLEDQLVEFCGLMTVTKITDFQAMSLGESSEKNEQFASLISCIVNFGLVVPIISRVTVTNPHKVEIFSLTLVQVLVSCKLSISYN